jgi:hypothetical protein
MGANAPSCLRKAPLSSRDVSESHYRDPTQENADPLRPDPLDMKKTS